ncbi:HD domain-containing protein [Candidatus Woesearchaeota archaeon]|nr:HD domain-containing protein [Candidatus Woesearchaeota archaeon]
MFGEGITLKTALNYHSTIITQYDSIIGVSDMGLIIPDEDIEGLVEQEFQSLRISPEKKGKIMGQYLKIVEDKDSSDVNGNGNGNGNSNGNSNRQGENGLYGFKRVRPHLLRVGLLNSRASKALGRPQELAFTSGLLHDFGKTSIKDKTVYNANDFNDEHREEMKSHVESGFNMIHSAFPEEASVILWHHHFQKNPYPEVERIKELIGSLPFPRFFISKYMAARRFMREGLQLALVDFYDSLVTRNNKKYDGAVKPADSYDFLVSEYPGYMRLINRLYKGKVFGQDYAKVLAKPF